jgi:DNA-directed RNA polymerase subunit M/transcription elongation factor TFIIS
VDALDALALELEEHLKQIDLQREYCDDLADEMEELHDAIYDLEESVGIESADDSYDDDKDDEQDDTTESYISMTCPSCAYSFYYKYEEGKESEKLVCPSCGEEFNRSL